MQGQLDLPPLRYLPAVSGEGFRLEEREELAPGLQRLGVQQCESAIAGLVGGDIDAGIHEARKAMKRVRAILRLVRPRIGERVYRFENDTLRDAARLVAPVRDSVVAVETVEEVAGRFHGSLSPDVFEELAARLGQRAARTRRSIVEEGDAVDRLRVTLERSRIRFAAWPIDEGESRAYGGAFDNRFPSVESGLTATYRRGRREMRRAYASPSTETFHAWRKRVKYLRHQTEVLEPLWPEMMSAAASALSDLGDLLGDEHDLADLLALLAIDPQLCPDPVERSLLAALVQHRRAELRASARRLGSRIYAEEPGRFVTRLGRYWEAAWQPVGVGIRLEA